MRSDSIVLLFIKAPQKGLVKSRLAAAIGPDAALELYKSFVLDVVEMLQDAGYPFRICFYPVAAQGAVSDWLGPRHQYAPQEGDDLGERMKNAFQRIFSEGYRRAVLIGSDIPDLAKAVLQESFASLEKNDLVLGPAADGGYYLMGFNKDSFLPELFHGIEWSSPTVFRDTVDIARAAKRSLHLAPEWNDVDSVQDLRKLFKRNESTGFTGSRTMTYLRIHRKDLFPD